MPGSLGTGQPISFKCSVERRELPWEAEAQRARGGHKVKLTGRKKPYYGRRGSMRVSHTAREYECSCGHTGWSAHIDLEQMEQRLGT